MTTHQWTVGCERAHQMTTRHIHIIKHQSGKCKIRNPQMNLNCHQNASASFLSSVQNVIKIQLSSQQTERLGIAIPGSQIPGSRPFSPIPNPGSGDVPILGFREYKNLLKLYFFCMSNDRNKNFSHQINKIFYERQSTTSCCVL